MHIKSVYRCRHRSYGLCTSSRGSGGGAPSAPYKGSKLCFAWSKRQFDKSEPGCTDGACPFRHRFEGGEKDRQRRRLARAP